MRFLSSDAFSQISRVMKLNPPCLIRICFRGERMAFMKSEFTPYKYAFYPIDLAHNFFYEIISPKYPCPEECPGVPGIHLSPFQKKSGRDFS